MSDQPASLAEALALLQTQLPEIKKGSENPHFRSRYADLADVSRDLLPVMGKLGLSFTCMPTLIPHRLLTMSAYPVAAEPGEVPPSPGGVLVLEYVLRHAGSNEHITGFYPLPASGSPQQIGSAITYARRYVLCAVTGAVAEEDDDGAAASAPAAPKPRRESPPRRPASELPRNTDGSVSRSRTTDDELAATGQMTDAQIRAHGKLEREVKGTGPQGTERLTATPESDVWLLPPYEGPGSPQTPVRTPRAAQPVDKRIIMHFDRFGITDRDVRLGYTALLVGRDTLGSTKDLTAVEGVAVEKALARCKDREAFDQLLDRGVAADAH